jgi:uncharacterized protein with PIN domain
MRFIAEENMARLAKELRALGYDVVIAKAMSTDAIITQANRQSRIFLTRNKKIAKMKKKFSRKLITTDISEKQILELSDYIVFAEDKVFTRCLECNEKLQVRKEADNSVPDYVRDNHREFMYCSKCKKYYWKGTHYRTMLEHLRNVFIN